MDQSERSIRVRQGLAALVIVLILAAAYPVFVSTEVCEQEATQAGQIVEVCRRLQMTDLPVLAGAAALLVALGTFFTEVGAFGISLKREVAQAKSSADNAKSSAENAKAASEAAARAAELAGVVSRKAEEAAAFAQGAERSVAKAEQLFTQLAMYRIEPQSTSDADENIRPLAAEYNAARELPRGPRRTELMTNIVARMVMLANSQGPKEVDVAPWLGSKDRGLRLAAYAFLHTNPAPAMTPLLAQSAVEEDKPFGQYWALRALRRQVSLDPESLDLNSRRRLEDLLINVGPSTDRGYELHQLLEIRNRRDNARSEGHGTQA